jgi:hypothetical protein
MSDYESELDVANDIESELDFLEDYGDSTSSFSSSGRESKIVVQEYGETEESCFFDDSDGLSEYEIYDCCGE